MVYLSSLTYLSSSILRILLICEICLGTLAGGRQHEGASSHVFCLDGNVGLAINTDGAVEVYRLTKLIDGLKGDVVLGILYQMTTFREEGYLQVGLLLFLL